MSGKILVVDDDRLVLATVVHGLSEAGYIVIDADNGDDAILLAREHRPDLALLDIRMEGMSGFDVAAYLRDHLQTPFMFLSAFADEETTAKVRELGAVAYLVKPLDIRQIVPAVESAFEQISARRSPASLAIGDLDENRRDGYGERARLPEDGGAPARAPNGIGPASIGVAPRAADGQVSRLGSAAEHIAMAVGVLMHRYSLPRGEALDRLTGQARASGQPIEAHALAMLEAVEMLSRGNPR